jgi:protein involved in polysaccharide export with SLBB domain
MRTKSFLRTAMFAVILACASSSVAAQSALSKFNVAPASVASIDSTEDYVRVGDKIALWVAGYPALNDTFTVAEGYKLRLPEIPELSLASVRRRDVQKVLTDHLTKFYKEPQVTATVLLELAISGAVGKPGYVTVSTDALLRDAITAAGGYSQTASLSKVSIRRNAKEWIKPKEARKALEAGQTLTALQLRSGDEIVVGENRSDRVEMGLRVAALLTGLVGLYAAIGR